MGADPMAPVTYHIKGDTINTKVAFKPNSYNGLPDDGDKGQYLAAVRALKGRLAPSDFLRMQTYLKSAANRGGLSVESDIPVLYYLFKSLGTLRQDKAAFAKLPKATQAAVDWVLVDVSLVLKKFKASGGTAEELTSEKVLKNSEECAKPFLDGCEETGDTCVSQLNWSEDEVEAKPVKDTRIQLKSNVVPVCGGQYNTDMRVPPSEGGIDVTL
jgi:hypothetical protein